MDDTTGGFGAAVIVTEALPVFPALSDAVTVIVFEPTCRERLGRLNWPFVFVASMPFIFTLASGSSTTPTTFVESAVVTEPFAGVVMVMAGGAVS